MRHTTVTLLTTCLLLAAATVSCSKSADENARDCATALTKRTGGDSADTPTVSEAEKRTDALDDTLAGMVRAGHASLAKDAADAVEKKSKKGQSRPEACEPLAEDDYKALLMAKAIDGLGWTDKDGKFDKNKMLDGISKYE
ncbi:hypothetical protein DCW30_05805 [Streptomyces alfalfae]|uniref:Lipoprotein n=1 Tax=Streptomyces alfalfae TaxID=1642299 RepID=A0ABN4VUV4_9ACTN|nr:hypothetical protein [Streptomyces alfalfae]APY88184.1 hypothetical protein A7J05_23065 [Streptomyces alfalfae]AYA18581.1 hypothetical protein D3X13_22180 [Streptomyces fradiae]RXX46538.1 hypothetical protein DCW30_05805 [Streptomyces alfalfae]RZM90051.1 hypothetical protein D4104_25740 [Streptomyces alfalfae]